VTPFVVAARYGIERASAGMIGVNIGVLVPREPFSFGGWNDSKFGAGDHHWKILDRVLHEAEEDDDQMESRCEGELDVVASRIEDEHMS
jgi:hypothetical protein